MNSEVNTLLSVKTEKLKKFILYPNASLYFGLAMAVTWIGFSHSYFGRLGEVTIYHHIHGATAGCWMLLLVVQPLLYKQGKISLHRKVGKIGVLTLVPLLVLGGLKMMHTMLNISELYPPLVPYQLAYIDAVSLIYFISFTFLSVKHAGKIHLHARYMALTVLIILPPAITRLLFLFPWFQSFDSALNVSFIAVETVLVLLLLDDKRSGRIHQPYLFGFLLFVLLHISMNFAGNISYWQNMMNSFSSL